MAWVEEITTFSFPLRVNFVDTVDCHFLLSKIAIRKFIGDILLSSVLLIYTIWFTDKVRLFSKSFIRLTELSVGLVQKPGRCV